MSVADDAGDQLGRALHVIAAGEAQTLFTPRLGGVAASLGELVRLLDWLSAADADLVAGDMGLDTATVSGRRAAQCCARSSAGAASRTILAVPAAGPG